MSAKDSLSVKRRQIGEGVDSLQGGVLIATLVVGPLAFALPVLLLLFQLEPWLGDPANWLETGSHPLGRALAIGFIVGMVVFGLGFPLYWAYVGTERWWKRYYLRAWKLLTDGGLALLVVDDAALEPLYEMTERYPWLKWTAAGRPQSLDERIEFASDYWRALAALAEGQPRRLRAGVIWGNLTRRLDDSFGCLFNGCTAVLVVAFAGPLILVLLPLYVLAVGLVLQQQAFQAAMCDYFAGRGSHPETT